jgi:hypothetical protein
MSVRLTVVHSYSKKMLESGDNQIKKIYLDLNKKERISCVAMH